MNADQRDAVLIARVPARMRDAAMRGAAHYNVSLSGYCRVALMEKIARDRLAPSEGDATEAGQ